MGRRALRIFSLAAVLSFAGAHGAETEVGKAMPTGGHTGNAFIATWDDNGDGKVTRAEYEGVRKTRFATMDGDSNGSLTVDERICRALDRDIADERNASLKQTDTRFKSLDKDQDTFISRAEYDGSGGRAFMHLDRNKDGRITNGDADPAAKETPRRRSIIGMPTSHNLAGMLEIHDDDGDDVLTRGEPGRNFRVSPSWQF
jgi:Ca2+-binding EF-hand superfamily protein